MDAITLRTEAHPAVTQGVARPGSHHNPGAVVGWILNVVDDLEFALGCGSGGLSDCDVVALNHSVTVKQHQFAISDRYNNPLLRLATFLGSCIYRRDPHPSNESSSRAVPRCGCVCKAGRRLGYRAPFLWPR